MFMLEHTCDIWRNETVDTNGRTTLTQLTTDVRCLLLPMAQPTAVSQNMDIARAYDGFFETSVDIKVGDQLRKGDQKYTVRALHLFDTLHGAHIHCLLEQEVK